MELTERQKWALYQIVNGLRKDNVPEQTLGGYAGTGKAQPLSSLIATPKGFVRMGDIKAKHEVCTPSGRIAKVTKVFPQGIKQIFRVSFYDGNSVECCQDHLWKIIVSDKELSNPEEFDHTSKVMPLWDIINC